MYWTPVHTSLVKIKIWHLSVSDRCPITHFILHRFMIKQWNVFTRVVNKLPRTNNPLEGFHNALNRAIHKENPTLWNVLSAFQEEESHARLRMNHASRGEKPKQSKIYKDMNEKIFNLVTNYKSQGSKDRMKYLRMITYAIKHIEIFEEVEQENEMENDEEDE